MTNENPNAQLIAEARELAGAILRGERIERCTYTTPELISAYNAGQAACLLTELASRLERAE
jgi:hypothetical protein